MSTKCQPRAVKEKIHFHYSNWRTQMTSEKLERQKAAVRQWFTAFDNSDLETLQKLTGQACYKQTLDMLNWVCDTFSEHQLEIQELIAEDNRVMARVHSKGRHTGEFFGVPGTGRQWAGNQGAAIFRFERGLIVDGWQIWNIPLHLEKLGLKLTVSA
jgi:predicted ester cyclase